MTKCYGGCLRTKLQLFLDADSTGWRETLSIDLASSSSGPREREMPGDHVVICVREVLPMLACKAQATWVVM